MQLQTLKLINSELSVKVADRANSDPYKEIPKSAFR